MAIPTCALARRPELPPAGENSPHHSVNDRAALAKRIDAELGAIRQAQRAIVCICELFEHALSASSGKDHIDRNEVQALGSLVHAEFERRVQIAMATIALMQVPDTVER